MLIKDCEFNNITYSQGDMLFNFTLIDALIDNVSFNNIGNYKFPNQLFSKFEELNFAAYKENALF